VANLNNEQLRRLARLGAVARLEQIRAEEDAIRAEFPELFGGTRAGRGGRGRGGRRAANGTAPGAAAAAASGGGRTRSRRRKMSAAARKAVSERMRKYWADRRKAKAAK
jgi:hypothetical protein